MITTSMGRCPAAIGIMALAAAAVPAAWCAEPCDAAGASAAGPLSATRLLKVAIPAQTRLEAGSTVEGRILLGHAGGAIRFGVERAWKEKVLGPKKSLISWILRPLDLPARTLRIAASSAAIAGDAPVPVSVLRLAKSKSKGERIVWLLRGQPGQAVTRSAATAAPPNPLTVPAGTRLRAVILDPLHSSLNRDGDAVRAVLTEPAAGLPAGTEISGRITRAARARWLSRPGALRLGFQRIATPCGGPQAQMTASLTGLDGDEKTALRVDREGGISGGPQGTLKILLHAGASYAVGKLVDDLMEEGLKAAAGAAAGTAATAARYPSLGLGVFLFAIQRGRDVAMPAYQEVEITLSRDVTLSPAGVPSRP